MKRLEEILRKDARLVAGVLSGTSADGIDAALVRVRGHGLDTDVELLHFHSTPFSDVMRQALLQMGTGKVADLCRLNFELGERFADACLHLFHSAAVAPDEVDLIGSHGQTVYHVPRSTHPHGSGSTLQIGEASVIAERTGRMVVSDFRTRDIAAGGEGAPLSAYVDYLLYRPAPDGPPRALLNLGGIANVTLVARDLDEVFAFDTGPANMPLDEAMRAMSGGERTYDREGRTAAQGRVDENLLNKLLEHPYFRQPIPKSTGRETFGREFVLPLLRGKGQNRAVDVLATLTAFVAQSIRTAFDDFVLPRLKPVEVVVSGGGVHNLTLMGHLRRLFGGLRVRSLDQIGELGLNPDAKEAVIFAVLANETVHGLPNNLPGATGARWPVVLGKITP
ncbi:MAG: anhydro-N-acetylmuramic acid kinase [Planctomycetota bacterium]|nr:anhydro-N-acetylmuramic acid kinase [Planctomycetota bacterium]